MRLLGGSCWIIRRRNLWPPWPNLRVNIIGGLTDNLFKHDEEAANAGEEMGVKKQKGQGLAEYALIIAFVAIVVVVTLRLFGQTIDTALRGIIGQF